MRPASSHTSRPLTRVLATALPVLALLIGAARPSFGAPAPLPGGHIPISFGGDNTPGYPPLSVTGAREDPIGNDPNRASVVPFPNPFQGATAFRFSLGAGETGWLRIYTAVGRLVRGIELRGSGVEWRQVVWNGRDDAGRTLPSGLYFYRLRTGDRTALGRVILAR